MLYDKLGTLDWWDIGRLQAASYGYPDRCFGTPGFVFPTYELMSVIYATPGCSASSTLNYKCSPPSNVQYSTGSTTGTTTSTQNSFKTGVSLTATATLDPTHFILPLSGVSATAGYTVTSVQGNSTTVSKTASNTISWSPLSKDGIWHDFDIFQTVVNPAVMLRNWLDPVTLQTHVEWELGIPASDGVAFTYDSAVISVRCALAGYSNLTIAPSAGYPNPGKYDTNGTCVGSSAWWLPSNAPPGLTYSDYDQLLSSDPFWNADPLLPLNPKPSAYPQNSGSGPSRYTLQTYGYPYLHPVGTACFSNVWQQGVTNSNTTSSSRAWDKTASMSATFNITPAFKLQGTSKWGWSDVTSNQITKTNSQSAQASVMCSSINWTGPGFVTVWYDNLFGTYLFDLQQYPCPGCRFLLNGNVILASGVPVPGMLVDFGVGTTTYHTATDNNGHFVIYAEDAKAIGPLTRTLTGTLSVGGVSKLVTVGSLEEVSVVIPQPTPVIAVYREGSPGVLAGGGNDRRDAIAIGVTNLSGVTMAKNVTVTAITPTNSAIVYEPGDLALPFVIPGGASLKPGDTSNFHLNFIDTSGAAPAPFSFVITMKADIAPALSTTIKVP